MDALAFNNKNNRNNSTNQSKDRQNKTFSNLNSGSSPRNYDSSNYFTPSYDQGVQQTMNHNQATTENSTQSRPSGKDEKLRQDSISFYTNFGIPGSRFSTDSNSSVSNFLNLPNNNDQGILYDSNGRGLSVINNLFLPQTSQQSSGTQQPQSQQQPQLLSTTSQNYFPTPGEYSTYQIRRPSEQLEPFNPSMKLKNPSFSKKSSIPYLGGNSFSDTGGSDFDFFSKRDSVKTGRQSSFLNSNSLGDSSDFDFFSKRDSIKNTNDEEINFKDPNFTTGTSKRETKSEPDTPVKDDDSVPSRPQTAMELRDNFGDQQFRQPALPSFIDYEQQFPKVMQRTQVLPQPLVQAPPSSTVQILNQLPSTSEISHPPGYQFQSNEPQSSFQLHVQRSEMKSPSPTSTDSIRKQRKNAIQPMTAVKRVKRSRKDASSQEASPDVARYVSPPFHSAQTSPEGSNSHYSTPTQPLINDLTHHLIPNQEPLTRQDGRPLLGATKVDQLMLVIQARKKGVHQQIPRADDGTILDNGNGILPQQSELVGGIDKPKAKTDKSHECRYCHKTFTQSTHLEVHVRSHIGYKPFECNYCGKRFTQGGNLRTHMRLHTGEKPYVCETCGRKFSRKGNLAAHELTHSKLKPFECKLDNCNKAFTQLGNLKAHQNRFHLETLNHLTKLLAETDPEDPSVGPVQRDLLNYFAHLYKNSNRGIKGRGRRPDANDGTLLDDETKQGLPSVTSSSSNSNLLYGENDSSLMNFGNGEEFSNELDSSKSKISFKNVNYRD